MLRHWCPTTWFRSKS